MHDSKSSGIKHFTQHRVTIHNIDADTEQNEEITRLLLSVFHNVYVHDVLDGPIAKIQNVLLQMRNKTSLKIINIHLIKWTKAEEYIFLFGASRFESMQNTDHTMNILPEKNIHLLPAVETRFLCIDMKQMNMLLRSMSSSVLTAPSLQYNAYSNILDAMIAGKHGRDVNIFDIIVFEIPMHHVKRQKTAVYAQYARVCNKFNIMESTGIVSKLYVQIELKKKNNELRNYQYGPFPTFRTAASQCVS